MSRPDPAGSPTVLTWQEEPKSWPCACPLLMGRISSTHSPLLLPPLWPSRIKKKVTLWRREQTEEGENSRTDEEVKMAREKVGWTEKYSHPSTSLGDWLQAPPPSWIAKPEQVKSLI